MKMQKGGNHGQADGDDGKVKDDETCAETEALAPRSPRPSEDHGEPESAATPASQKPNRDKSRSMAALEMVRSERLDEQGFEKFFADPPAALVVLKGLRKLAERKVLLGRAPVRASGAGERAATSEMDVKKRGNRSQRR